MRVLTLTTPAALPRAWALARSLERHQPQWPHEIFMLAGGPTIVECSRRTGLALSSAAAALGVDPTRLIARYAEEDLETILAPALLAARRAESADALLHLPSSAWVLGPLESIERATRQRGVSLFDRAVAGVPDDGLEPAPPELEQRGRISSRVLAVAAGEPAGEFLEWWLARVRDALGSPDGSAPAARPEDRHWLARYLELAPSRFGTALLDEGFNLSQWNLHRHELRSGPRGEPLVDGQGRLGFLDLPGFDPTRPHRLAARASRVRVSRSPALRALCSEYALELLELGWRDLDLRSEVGRRLAGGLIYDDTLRELYGRAIALGEDFGEIFSDEGARAFTRWLAGPAPEGAAHGINRYVYYRVARERPDVLRAYPDLDGVDGAEYVRWCWAFGRRELSLARVFLPPVEGAAQEPVERGDSVATDVLARRTPPARASAPAPSPDSLGVRVTGYLANTLGLGAAARGYVDALRAAGVPVSTASVPLHHLELKVQVTEDYARHGFEDLVHQGGHGFEIVAVNADELPDLVERLGAGYFEGPRIGIWGWETNAIPARWQRAFALIDEIWVYSSFMANNIGAVAPVPVLALPPPVPVPARAPVPERLGVPDAFLFLFVFDYLSTIQRKNPVGLIEAFRRAFAAGEGPRLLIKTINAPLRPLADEEVLWAAHGRPDIDVIDRSLSAGELMGLMSACDCYVSLHRSEGFGLTMAEAMALGKPVIATGYSGNVDFMNAENSLLVDYQLTRVGAENDIYPPEGEWAEPDLEQAARLMRMIYEERELGARLGARAREDVARMLSPEATGAAMKRRLQELARRPR